MQDKNKFIVGTVKHGVMKQGQNIVFSPSNIKANIVSIEMNNAKINEAFPGYYVSIRIDAPDYDNEIKCGCVCGGSREKTIYTVYCRYNDFFLKKRFQNRANK